MDALEPMQKCIQLSQILKSYARIVTNIVDTNLTGNPNKVDCRG
jgi:hypothetical protein